MCEQCISLFDSVGRKFDLDGQTIKAIVDAFVEEKMKALQKEGVAEKDLLEMFGQVRQETQPTQPKAINMQELSDFTDFLINSGLANLAPKKKKDNDDFLFN